MIEITINSGQLQKLERALRNIKNGVPHALVPAINRALEHGRTVAKTQIRKSYTIKAKDIPIHLEKASYQKLEGEMTIKDAMLPLDHFRYSGGTHGRPLHAEVRIGKGGNIATGFVQTMPSTGYRGPFMRRGRARLPISKIMTISAPIMATQPDVGPVIQREMEKTLALRIDHEMERVLAKAEK